MVTNIKFVKSEMIANGTMAFYFEKPDGFEFRAGQFADYTLINPADTDEEGNIRGFSYVNAPHEEYIVFATRMRDTAFKRTISKLEVGDELKMDGPYGGFTLHKTESTPAVFLIGGIGVTPIRSMIADATHNKINQSLILLHSNKTLADAPFAKYFQSLASENPNFTYVPVSSDKSTGGAGETGYIDAEMVRRYVSDIKAPIYYLSGPAGMVKAMRELLISLEVNEDNIRTEEFSGY